MATQITATETQTKLVPLMEGATEAGLSYSRCLRLVMVRLVKGERRG